MSEPRLEDIGDYNSLKGEKKKVVWAVVMAGILMGVIYTIAINVYDGNQDSIAVEKNFKKVPMH